jgi:glycosyltransferase XagB
MAAPGGYREDAYHAAPNGSPAGEYWNAPAAGRSLSRQGAQSGRHRMRPTPNASVFLSKGQLAVAVFVLGAIAIAGYSRPRLTLTVAVGCCMAFYTCTALLKLVITLAGRHYQPPRCPRLRRDDPPLPRYAVLLPVRNEANMLPRLVARVDRLVYPRRRLLVLILIEHDDVETLTAARRLGIPLQSWARRNGSYVRVLIVPPGGPRTKPNALNAATDTVIREGCEFVTVYDAEDRPDPEQLLKAASTFRAADPQLACLQAELAFWNDDTNWITALYWVGYKIHFTRFLPGLARLGLPIPLGGTSNHFRVSALLDVALRPDGQIWDAYNLTEDADLGARLAAGGYRVGLLRSTTMEEAPVDIKVVDKQQRRWKAGYLQTGFVHLRQPLRSMRRMGPLRWLCFNALVLGVPVGFLLNPLFIGLTIAYFVTRAPLIMQLFPTDIYYLSLVLMFLGNFGLLYELAHTCLTEADRTRGHFGLVRYMLLAQLMWLWMSRSTYIALIEMITGRRGWHLTPHGHAERFDEPADRADRYHGERRYRGNAPRQRPALLPERSALPPAGRYQPRLAEYSVQGRRR